MKISIFPPIAVSLLAVSILPFSQTGCSKQEAPAPTAAATPAPAATPAAAPAVPAPVAALTPAPAAAPVAPPAAAAPAGLDFGDSASVTLTTKAWTALNDKKYDEAIAYAQKSIDLYKQNALDQQKALKTPPTVQADIQAQWALNDIGTNFYQLGQAYEKTNKTPQAVEAYKFVSENLPFAKCWDPKGWFWSPADVAKSRLKALELDTLK